MPPTSTAIIAAVADAWRTTPEVLAGRAKGRAGYLVEARDAVFILLLWRGYSARGACIRVGHARDAKSMRRARARYDLGGPFSARVDALAQQIGLLQEVTNAL